MVCNRARTCAHPCTVLGIRTFAGQLALLLNATTQAMSFSRYEMGVYETMLMLLTG